MQSKFEQKFGKYAIKNLSLILVLCYAVGYFITILDNNFGFGIQSYISLNPYEIIHNFQIWRLFTWVLIPPSSKIDFWILITLYFYYSIGTSLELTWGTYRYNVYLFSGLLFTVVGAFVVYFISLFNMSFVLWGFSDYATVFSTYYISMSIFLAYAATFPDAQILLFFIIPIRVKYLGIIYGAILIYDMIQYISAGSLYLPLCIMIVASLLNFVIFFFTSRKKIMRVSPVIRIKKAPSRQSTVETPKKNDGSVTRHKCAQCGATEVSNPELQFRFCSKCNGNYEYCEKHIFTHIHVN